MPQLTRLRRQRRHQFRMRVPQAVDRNPSAQIQKSPTVIAGQPAACARDKRKRSAIIGGQDRRDHRKTFLTRRAERKPRVRHTLSSAEIRGAGRGAADISATSASQGDFNHRFHALTIPKPPGHGKSKYPLRQILLRFQPIAPCQPKPRQTNRTNISPANHSQSQPRAAI